MSEISESASHPKKPNLPDGPTGWPVVGVVPHFLWDTPGFMLRSHQRYGDVFTMILKGSSTRRFVFSEPELIRKILVEHNDFFTKTTRVLQPLFGDGLLLSEGPTWRKQRRVSQSAFGPMAIQRYNEIFKSSVMESFGEFDRLALSGDYFDMTQQMMNLTLSIVVKTLFRAHVPSDIAKIGHSFTVALRHTRYLSFSATPWGKVLLWYHKPKFDDAMNILNAVIHRMIDQGRRNLKNGDQKNLSLLEQILLNYESDSDSGVSDQELRDQVMTIFLAGHETTALALTWVWYLLSKHDSIEKKLYSSLRESGAYARMVFEETLRLYPSAWILARKPISNLKVNGFDVAAGSDIIISPYLMGRHKAYWTSPETFDPERFSPENRQKIIPYSYFPFGGGPRICIGNQFALQEAETIISMLCDRYRFILKPGFVAKPQALVTMRPKNGMPMRVERRIKN